MVVLFHIVMFSFRGVFPVILGEVFVSQRLLDEWSFPKFQFEFCTPEVPFFCFPKPRLVCAKTLCLKATRPAPGWDFSSTRESEEQPSNMDVSKNSGFSPQIIHLSRGFSIIFTIHFGVPLFLETPISKPFSTFGKEMQRISFSVYTIFHYLAVLVYISFLQDEQQAAFKTGLWYLSKSRISTSL